MPFHRHASIFAIILVAVVVFFLEQAGASRFSESYGAVPSAIANATRQVFGGDSSLTAVREVSRLFTAIFLHGDAEHILYNMVFLWTFGHLISQILGQWWALAAFLLCGVGGNIVQVCLNLNSSVPVIGASGGICGLEGTYLGLAICWRLPWPDIWPLAHPIPPMQLGAFAVLGFVGDMIMLANHNQQIAYGAHIGGFFCGFAIATVLTTLYPTVDRFEQWQARR